MNSKIITEYRGKHLHFRKHESGWEYVSRAKATEGVTIIAVTPEKRIILVKQFRPPVNKEVIELPAGLVGDADAFAQEKYTNAVKRELPEEVRYNCETVTLLLKGSALPGVTDELNCLCVAGGLRRIPGVEYEDEGEGVMRQKKSSGKSEEGEKITVFEVPLEIAPKWLQKQCDTGNIVDLKVYSGLFFANSPCLPL